LSAKPYLVYGLGVTGAAVAEALVRHGEPLVAVDDRPSDTAVSLASELGVRLVAGPDAGALAELVGSAAAVVPAPGLPAQHPLFSLARDQGVPVLSEFDLAAKWDARPWLAITGTDGKTTVTELTRLMLEASGIAAAAVGNTEVPLVAAIEDPAVDVFVVEASSFRLDHSLRFAPAVGTWLNFASDHLDNHPSLDAYEAAKARIWRDQDSSAVAVGNLDDPVVARHLSAAPARQVGFGTGPDADFRVADGALVGPEGELCRVAELRRSYPHDLLNALAAAATALNGRASVEGVRAALLAFGGLPHRVALVGEAGGVRYVDDSKATTPHAVLAAVAGFESVVLICGGRNKGLDLSVLATASDRLRSVVAIGEAADEVVAAFTGHVRVDVAGSMEQAVALAKAAAEPGDTVLLSPGCASFDWYGSYGERGDDFVRVVLKQVGATT
jgi:UDP-N-acetylmuramoylalanine--D-glutamate ligase